MTASYEESGYEAHLLHNGYSRTIGNSSNMWRAPAKDDQWIAAHWDKTVSLSSIHLKFDSNLSQEIMLSLYKGQSNQPKTLPDTLVKSFTLDFYDGKALVVQHHIPDNHQRFVRINLEPSIRCNRLRIRFHETYGCSDYRLFELRAY